MQLATKTLAVLMTLGKTPVQMRQELKLQMILAVVYSIVRGYAAPEIERARAALSQFLLLGDGALLRDLAASIAARRSSHFALC